MRTDWKGLYLLGSLNRHITVHSQQRRAINLIHALMQEPGGLDNRAVAVVGAGFAGLTAAAFALEKTTATVSLFDVAPRPLWLHDNCVNRWIHPGIYDWPLPGALEPCTDLPVLNWRAAAARDVAAEVRAQWERIAASAGRLRLQLETRVDSVKPTDDGRLLIELPGGRHEQFDVVVLAVGFGLEPGGAARVSYWNDADGLDGIEPGSQILVSGFGDGGLADVLRLCLPSIRQDSLIELVRQVPDETRRKLVEWEQHFQADSAALDQQYTKLRVESIVKQLKKEAPALARVTLVGKGHLYGPRSAILNRFLVSQLRQARGDDSFELIKAPVDEASLTELPGGKWRVNFVNGGGAREFDHIVLRLGPRPVYPLVAPLDEWKVGTERRKHWYELPQALDRTRIPMWQGSTATDTEERRPDFLAYESSSRPWCLVLHPSTEFEWNVHARLALKEAKGNYLKADVKADVKKVFQGLNVEPLLLASEDAIDGAAAIRCAVRALCAADIVIADVTGYEPCLLLLLGIRAAVRRSVTIACTRADLSDDLWKELPFNIKELNLISFADEKQGHGALVEALGAGLAQSHASTHYLDLPVYDYVREEAAEDASRSSPAVLFLRAFKNYSTARELFVQKSAGGPLGLPDAQLEAVIDQRSPRLAGQRLYEAIRHWNTCVVDLTWWRPNVLFELGVRLAVRPAETYCLIDPSVPSDAGFASSRAKLNALIQPAAYNVATNDFPERLTALDVARGAIYETAVRHFRRTQDPYSTQVDTMLVRAEVVTRGKSDPLEAVDLTPLYARDNDAYGAEVRHSVFEQLCAAWYYLAERRNLSATRPIDLLEPGRADAFRRFSGLGSRLKAALAYRYEECDRYLRRRIEAAERSMEDSGATEMSELLVGWAALRADPPWQIDLAALPEDDREAQIDDWKLQLEHLRALEHRLTQLSNPVCELPLQSIRSDCARFEAVLAELGGGLS